MVSTQYSASAYLWSGPLPHPEVLSRYNDAFPGCAERIVVMAEQQALHRQKLEAAFVEADISSQRTGVWLGFLLALIVISSGAWLVHEGRVEWGAGFITVPLVALVSIFVYGKRQQRKDLRTEEDRSRPETSGSQPELHEYTSSHPSS